MDDGGTGKGDVRDAVDAAETDQRRNPAAGSDGRPSGRGLAAFLLLALGVVATALAVPALWVPSGLLHADHVAAEVGPLANDDALRGYLAGSLTASLSVAYGRPSGRAANVLDEAVRAELYRPGFEADWRREVVRAQPQLREALIGKQPQVGPDDGKVFVDLLPTGGRITAALRADPRFAATPTLEADQFRVSLLNLRSFEGARSPARTVVNLRWLWLSLAVVGFGAGLAVARRRWRALAMAAVAVAVVLAGQLPLMAAVRSTYLDELPVTSIPRPAAGRLIDALTSSLRARLAVGAVLALVLAVGAVVVEAVGRTRAKGRHPTV